MSLPNSFKYIVLKFHIVNSRCIPNTIYRMKCLKRIWRVTSAKKKLLPKTRFVHAGSRSRLLQRRFRDAIFIVTRH